jgi:hypothetical protein
MGCIFLSRLNIGANQRSRGEYTQQRVLGEGKSNMNLGAEIWLIRLTGFIEKWGGHRKRSAEVGQGVVTNLSTQSLIKGFIWLGETHCDASPSIGPPAFLSHSKHSEVHTLSTHVQTNTHVICHCCTVCVYSFGQCCVCVCKLFCLKLCSSWCCWTRYLLKTYLDEKLHYI